MAGYYPDAPGPQMASKYPRVGKNYLKWGEIPGFLYDYSTDQYRRDPKVNQEIGLVPKDKSLTDVLLPSLAVTGGAALATEAGKAAIPAAKGLLGLGGTEAATTTAASNAGTGAAFGAGAESMVPEVSSLVGSDSPLVTSGGATEASALSGAAPYLGAAGAGLGAYGVYNATKMNDKKKAAISGGLSGAGMGAGLAAAAPLIGLGPLGWGALGLMALGGGALGSGLGAGLAHKTTKQIQAERWKDLTDKGYTGVSDFYNQLDESEKPSRNQKFAESRNEADLTAEDIWGSPDIIGAAGNRYFGSWDEAKRRKFSEEALKRNLITEKKGGIYGDDAALAALADELDKEKGK